MYIYKYICVYRYIYIYIYIYSALIYQFEKFRNVYSRKVCWSWKIRTTLASLSLNEILVAPVGLVRTNIDQRNYIILNMSVILTPRLPR